MAKAEVTLQELGPGDDLAQVLRLCRDFFTEYQDHHAEFFDTVDLGDEDISGRFLESIESDRSATIIALAAGKVVGYALVTLKDQPGFYKFSTVGAVSGLMVDKKYRRKGIGRLLITRARAFFRKHGVKYFILYTAVSNREALDFYRHVGLEPLQTVMIGESEDHDLS